MSLDIVRAIARPLARAVVGRRAGGKSPNFDDGRLHAFLCGTGTPIPAAGRAGSSVAILAGGKLFLVDSGPGSWAVLSALGLPESALSAVFLSHFHSDHIGDLGESCVRSWIDGRRGSLPVYGPEGLDRVVGGMNAAYGPDRESRRLHHGDGYMPREAGCMEARIIPFRGDSGSSTVFDEDGLRVTAFPVDHPPIHHALGYRFDYRGASIVVSGDTKKSESLIDAARGTDLLIHDVIARHFVDNGVARMRELGDERVARMSEQAAESHAGAEELRDIAERSGVKKLVMTHAAPSFSPRIPSFLLRWLFLGRIRAGFGIPVVFGNDGMRFSLGERVRERSGPR